MLQRLYKSDLLDIVLKYENYRSRLNQILAKSDHHDLWWTLELLSLILLFVFEKSLFFNSLRRFSFHHILFLYSWIFKSILTTKKTP